MELMLLLLAAPIAVYVYYKFLNNNNNEQDVSWRSIQRPDDHYESRRQYVPDNQPTVDNPPRNIHTKADLEQLHAKAVSFIPPRRQAKLRLKYFYRDKSQEYYDDILRNHDGIMKVYRKDFHGDPKSPINGRLLGLFLSVNVQFGTSDPVNQSVYGEKRLLLDPETLYQQCPNLYFTDFYCVHKPHYVTLVMTRSGSEADRFCWRHLIKLDWQNNAFLERRPYPFGYAPTYHVISCGLWVEVFYTEDVDLLQAAMQHPLFDVTMTGFRSGGSVGLKKNLDCILCNI